MFGLFKPKPPLEPWEKAWTEDRLCRMATQFNLKTVLETPTLVPDFAGIPSVATAADVPALLDFLHPWMQVDSKTHVQMFSDADVLPSISDAPSDPDSVAIRVHERHLLDRNTLIAVVARQLAQLALAKSPLGREAWAGDLYPVFCGLGVFAANATVRETGKSDGLSWRTTLQSGYLPARIFGYALALREFVRNQAEAAEWSDSLRLDAATTFQDGLTYLDKTQDSVFTRDLLTKPRTSWSEATLMDDLRTGSPSRKIAAMWSLAERLEANSGRSPQVEDLLRDCLLHKDADVRAEAAATLPLYSHSAETIQDVTDALKDRSDTVRIAAAAALRTYAGSTAAPLIVEELTEALQDDVRLVAFNAATSLAAFGASAEPALKSLLKRLRRSLNECNEVESQTVLSAIQAIASDTRDRLTQFFGESDPEYLTQSLEILDDLQHPPSSAA